MSALAAAQSNAILSATLAVGGTNTVGAVSPVKIRLTTTAPSSSAAGTELSATGYTAGGTAIAFATPASESTAGPAVSAILWTNSGGTSWAGIVGLGLWDATPTWWYFGLWSGQPIVIAAGNSFQLAVGAVAVSLV